MGRCNATEEQATVRAVVEVVGSTAARTALTTVFPPRNDSYIGPISVFALKPIGVVWSVLLMRANHRAVSDRTGIPSHAAADELCQGRRSTLWRPGVTVRAWRVVPKRMANSRVRSAGSRVARRASQAGVLPGS